jgi:hypothetical protein
MSEKSSVSATAGRTIIILATGLLVITSPWTLQAFVPEPYFLRTPHQLVIMSTPNGSGSIERSLLPFYAAIGIEILALAAVAALGWCFRIKAVAVVYFAAIVAMAGMTLLRLTEAFRGLM